MSVKARLWLLSSVLLVGMLIIGFIGFNSAKKWSNDIEEVSEQRRLCQATPQRGNVLLLVEVRMGSSCYPMDIST